MLQQEIFFLHVGKETINFGFNYTILIMSFFINRSLLLLLLFLKCSVLIALDNTAFMHYVGEASLSFNINEENKYYWGEGVAATDIQKGICMTPILSARQLYSCGTAQADIRPITYEDGSPLIENNKLYYSASSRTGGPGPIIFELLLGTSQIKMVGCLRTYFKGKLWRGAAPHIMYNRRKSIWQITIPIHTKSEHILAKGVSFSDVRFGVTPIYFEPLDYQSPTKGDEDAMIFYDNKKDKWCLIYCSLRGKDNKIESKYLLRIQESNDPDKGFSDRKKYAFCRDVDATGVSVTKIGGDYFVFSGDSRDDNGNNRYVVLDYNNLNKLGYLNIDIPDKGFRGWNNLTPIIQGDRIRYVLVTFDRGQSSNEDNWTYGNMYLYYSKETNFDFKKDTNKGLNLYEHSSSPQYSPLDLHFVRYMSRRNMLSMNLLLSEINLGADILAPYAEVYSICGDKIKQVSNRLYSQGRESMIIGGIHQPFSNYEFPLFAIEEGEERYLYIGNIDQIGGCFVKISFRRQNGEIIANLYQNDIFKCQIGKIRLDSLQAQILIGYNRIFIYTD